MKAEAFVSRDRGRTWPEALLEFETVDGPDIDLIFVYPDEGETDGPRSIANREYFDRLGQRVIGALHDVTPQGYVFRVDMRLRPYGDSGPLTTT